MSWRCAAVRFAPGRAALRRRREGKRQREAWCGATAYGGPPVCETRSKDCAIALPIRMDAARNLLFTSPIMTAPNTLTATELCARIDAGALTAEAIVRSHLERIDARDADVLAWSHLARDAALERARLLDRGPRAGPAARHSDRHQGHHRHATTSRPATARRSTPTHRPLADAATVALPRAAGAILLGKTVTTEFANRHPGKTRNPHNPAHTPGGSSSRLGGRRSPISRCCWRPARRPAAR